MSYHLIFLQEQVVLSAENYSHWRVIQKTYASYMTSIRFTDLEEDVDYLMADYHLSRQKVRELVEPIASGAVTHLVLDEL